MSNVKRLVPFALVAAFAFALYVYVLPLPFFRDDMVMLLWLKGMSWGRLWVDATGFPYYRPLSFSTLKLSELIFGWPEPISLHVLNLLLHAANSVCVALLTERFFDGQGKRIAALSAGLLFAAYPFSYEIVPSTGPIFQLQATFFGLAAALCYAQFRSLSNSKWLLASLAMALLGTFTCEYGVILPLFIAATESRVGRPTPSSADKKPALQPVAIFFVFAVVYLAAWVVVPKSRAELPLILQGSGPAWRDMPVTALYYLQGLTFPLQTLAWPLVRATGLSAHLAVLIIALLTLGGISIVFVRRKQARLLALALIWFAIAVAPMWPTLNADYTLNGPRLHYLPALGATMLWGSLIALLTDGRRARSALGLLVLAATLAQSLWFLRGMADVITLGGRLTDDVSRVARSTPADESLLIVNFPSWIGKREGETTYALGEEGISFLPGYSTMRDMVWLNTRQNRDVNAVTFTNTVKDWKYGQRLGLLVDWKKLVKAMRAARHVWAVEYQPDTWRLSEAGAILAEAPALPQATFDDLIGVRLLSGETQGRELRVELSWTNLITVPRELPAFVHLYNSDGRLVAQQDGYPMLGLYPSWLQPIGQPVRDVRHIPLPAALPAGRYVVGVGLYDAETGQRSAARSPQGARFQNDVYLIYAFEWPGSRLQTPDAK